MQQHHRQDNTHQRGAENMNHPPGAGRLARDGCRFRVTRRFGLRTLDVLGLAHWRSTLPWLGGIGAWMPG